MKNPKEVGPSTAILKSLPCRKKALVSGHEKDHEAQKYRKNNRREMRNLT